MVNVAQIKDILCWAAFSQHGRAHAAWKQLCKNTFSVFSGPGNTQPPHGLIAQGKDLLSVKSLHGRISFKYAKIPLNITEHHSLSPSARISKIPEQPALDPWGGNTYPLTIPELRVLHKGTLWRNSTSLLSDKNIFSRPSSSCFAMQKK